MARHIPEMKTAISIYYRYPIAIGTPQIKELFGIKSSDTARRYKNEVKKEMLKRNCPVWRMDQIDTHLAYKVWGLDIAVLEEALKKRQQLGI